MRVSTALFDADGCLWVGPTPVPGAPEILVTLREAGVKCFIVTNNSTNTREEIAAKLRSKGFFGITKDMVVSACYATALYLLSLGFHEESRRVFVVGEKGLVKELCAHGIDAVDGDYFDEGANIGDLKIDRRFLAVVAGCDTTLSYRKLAIATRIVIENDAYLIGTNSDAVDPLGHGIFIPDTLPTVMALEACTGRKAVFLGKPTAAMFDPVLKMHEVVREETIMIGDRLNTDIKFAKTVGIKSAVVLTGITTREEAQAESECPPDMILESVADLANAILMN
jgi:4-nitrophenyl phosphatase